MTGLFTAVKKILNVTNPKSKIRNPKSKQAPTRQISAVMVLLAMLMPITAPIPAWAYDLNLPRVTDDGLRLTAPGPSSVGSLSLLKQVLQTSLAAFISPTRKSDKESDKESEKTFSKEALERKVKQIETPVDDIRQLTIGQTVQLSAIPLDEGGNAVHGIALEWVSKNDLVLKIDDGRAIAKAVGETVLTVKAGSASKNLTVKIAATDEAVKSKLAKSLGEANKKELHSSQAFLVEESEQSVRDSTYTPENNIGSPPNKSEMDSPNSAVVGRIKHRAGIANYSFGVPFASLPGRGIDASIGMTYNSRVWNKTGEGSPSFYQFNVDNNWLAPGFTVGYGILKSHFSSRTIFNTNYQFKTYNEIIPEGSEKESAQQPPSEIRPPAAVRGRRTGWVREHLRD